MIKARGMTNDRNFLLFGLSEENIVKLKEDQPIVIEGEEMGLPYDIVLMYGADENEIAQRILQAQLKTKQETGGDE